MKKGRYILLTLLVMGLILTQLVGCSSKKEAIKESGETVVHADYEMYGDIEKLVNNSDIIITGKVKKVNSAQEINVSLEKDNPLYHVYTVSEIVVEKVIKGNINPGDVVKVKQLGGEVKNIKYVEQNVKYFSKNMKGMFFLKTYSNDIPCSLLNPVQGDIEIIDEIAKPHKNNILFVNITEE
ncbi:MAG: hypothetical protein VR72_19940 [Clostridiaceae bacterium BRH_c20a]|nr:MAG: hypothetical protein VR72_19940 [Clostridiaceae bacterium BRH_c20a]